MFIKNLIPDFFHCIPLVQKCHLKSIKHDWKKSLTSSTIFEITVHFSQSFLSDYVMCDMFTLCNKMYVLRIKTYNLNS